ncbi:MAG: hypothetical protein H0U35_01285 [Sporichthyaceae bacterium]|nr:hypothetical protein [Sporichthyaceae bacterium]
MALTRRGRVTVATGLLVLIGLVVAYVLLRTPLGTVLGLRAGPPCTVTVSGNTFDWSAEHAMTATTVAGVGTRIGASVNGVAEAVDRGLTTLEGRDPPQSVSPREARSIYRALPDVATPDEEAIGIAEALLGYDGDALTCAVPLQPDLAREEPGELGLTPRADVLRTEMRAVFGKQVLGGFSPEGVRSGHIDGSAHYEGRAVDVFFRPVSQVNQRLGWQLAQWSVAHAQRLGLATVIFDRRLWTATRSLEGWRDYRHPDGDTANPVLLHEDHVHLDVIEGR